MVAWLALSLIGKSMRTPRIGWGSMARAQSSVDKTSWYHRPSPEVSSPTYCMTLVPFMYRVQGEGRIWIPVDRVKKHASMVVMGRK